MGYCSDVKIAIPKQIAMLDKNLPEILQDSSNDGIEDTGEVLIYSFYSIKWYFYFPEIQEVIDYLSKLDENKMEFIRIGEDYDDYEHRGNLVGFYLERTIEHY